MPKRSRITGLAAFCAATVLAASPLMVAAQEECEFDGSVGANTAAEKFREISEETPPDELTRIFQEAYDAVEPELDDRDEHAIAYLLATQALIGLHRYDEALATIQRFDEMAPECGEYSGNQRFRAWVELFNAGIDAYSSGESQTALDRFEMASQFHADLRSYNNAALVYLEMGNNAKAIETYQNALANAPADADPTQLQSAIKGLGDALQAEGRNDEAMAAYRSFLDGHPDDVVIQIRYALTAAEAGQDAEASEIFGTVLQRDDLGEQQWVEVGVGLYNSGDFANAATAFSKARTVNPYNKEAMENFVNASVQANRPGPVLALADTLVNWYPYDETNYQLLASALAKASMDDRAMAVIADQEATDVVFHYAQMAPAGSGYVVRGSLESRTATGTLQIPFEFVDVTGAVIGTETLTMQAPPAGQVENFQLRVDLGTPVAGFRYKTNGS